MDKKTLELLKNHPLKYAAEEFSLADCAYRKMVAIGVGDFTEYEKAWREFLHRIERVWVKTQAAACGMPGWKKIESEVEALRTSDPLLGYLKQARNVDEHTISDLTKDWNPQFKAVQRGDKIKLTWKEWDRPLLPVKNRGIVYNPPEFHLGKSIEHLKHKGKAEPRVIAELALEFYCDFLNSVSKEVVGNK
ncbi:MAG: hypothetical protein PHX20_03325 [Candidatus Omnitrophica bacterium]|nr:hypothetical protein [Candidatus Omnitrophota bacterium]MDD5436556.1 hypothetical protein [Candidatus Omnitrophota bacterium]